MTTYSSLLESAMTMRQLFLALALAFVLCGWAGTAEKGDKSGPQPAKEPTLIAKPDAFKPLFSPDCSH